MKAIVLTYAPITEEEKDLLKKTDIFKIACNTYRAELNPHIRLTSDNIVQKCLDCDDCPVISINYDLERERVINGCHYIDFHSSLLNCVYYLVTEGYTSILLVANNLQTTFKDISDWFQNLNRKGINTLKEFAHIYKYSDVGVFDVPTKSIKDFIMNEENLILGITEEDKSVRLLRTLAFSEDFKYEIKTIGLDNASIEGGSLLLNILPYEKQEEILNGEEVITYKDMEIKRISKIPGLKESDDVEKMSYNDMQKYVKDNAIKVDSFKKEVLIEAIRKHKNG